MDAFMQGHSQHGCNMGGSQATLYPPQLQSQHALEEQGSSQPWPGQLEEPVGQPPRLSLHGREKLVPFAPQHFDAQPANSTGPAVTPEVHLSASLEELQELQDDASMVSQAHPDQSNAAAQPTKVASIFTKGFYKKVCNRHFCLLCTAESCDVSVVLSRQLVHVCSALQKPVTCL